MATIMSPLLALLVCFATTSTALPFRGFRNIWDNSVHSDDNLSRDLSYLEKVLYGQPSDITGQLVAEWHEGMEVNPEELGSYAEGDILFPAGRSRNGVKADSSRWPNGVIPYILSPFFNEKQKKLILAAMEDYHKHTCIVFKPYEGEESDYIRLTAGNTGCWSSVGRTGGAQSVNLQVPGCVSKKGTIIHELMHAVGFLHEQSRYERDDFVNIQWQNIQKGKAGNFEKSTMEKTNDFGIEYDYGSVMHYSPKAFSNNGQPTIVPKVKTRDVIGQREGLSSKDIDKIRKMYKCKSPRSLNDFFF